MTMPNPFLRAGCALAVVVSLAACSPQSEREREFMAKRASEEAERDMLRVTITESARDTDVLLLVKNSPAIEGGVDTETWVSRQMDELRGQAVFPRWEVARRGSTKYEARYSFTLLDENVDIVKHGWKWDVDMSLKVVSAPRQLMSQDRVVRPRSTESEQQQHRIDIEEASLE